MYIIENKWGEEYFNQVSILMAKGVFWNSLGKNKNNFLKNNV
jgi:hypothetical protein